MGNEDMIKLWITCNWIIVYFFNKTFRVNVSSFKIQNASSRCSCRLILSLLMFEVYLSYQIDLNFACLMNLYPCFLNWLQAGIAYELLMVFLWLFSCTSNGVPALATYWILHKVHSMKYNILLLLQLTSQKCFKFLFAW